MYGIAIGGKAFSGKTTLRNTIVKALTDDIGVARTNIVVGRFAEPIIQAASMLGVHKNTSPDLFRGLATRIGDTCRGHDPQFFVKHMEKELLKVNTGRLASNWFIIDDVRYPNELDFLYDRDFVTVYLDASDSLREQRGGAYSSSDHSSERSLKADDFHTFRSFSEDLAPMPLLALAMYLIKEAINLGPVVL